MFDARSEEKASMERRTVNVVGKQKRSQVKEGCEGMLLVVVCPSCCSVCFRRDNKAAACSVVRIG